MGPRSSDRGYAIMEKANDPLWRKGFNGSTVLGPWLRPGMDKFYDKRLTPLQWVHGPRTVVTHDSAAPLVSVTGIASMGPRSSDRGYGNQIP